MEAHEQNILIDHMHAHKTATQKIIVTHSKLYDVIDKPYGCDTVKRGNFGFSGPLQFLSLLCACGTRHSFLLHSN